MKVRVMRRILGTLLLCGLFFISKGQVIPEVLDTGTLNQQLEYLQTKTNVYNNYRAVRNDMFLKLKSNVLDTEAKLGTEIEELNTVLGDSKTKITTLQSDLTATKAELEEAIKTKNSFNLLGLNIDKILYNTVLWVIILGLAVLAIVAFFMYKKSMAITNNSKKDLEEIKGQFEAYKKQAREKQERLVVSHHKEMMKMKKEIGI